MKTAEHPDKPTHPSPLELLIWWGETRLLHPAETDRLEWIAEGWRARSPSADVLGKEMATLETDIHQTIRRLTDPDTLDLDDGDWPTIHAHLKNLDKIVFLIEALDAFPDADAVLSGIHERAEEMFGTLITEHESTWMRLIPLNERRRQTLASIPPDVRYLFPWYEEWSDLPEDAFDILADHQDDLALDRPPLEEEIEAMSGLIHELQTDPALMDHIRREARIFRTIKSAATEDPPQTSSSADDNKTATPDSTFFANPILDWFRNIFAGPSPVKLITATAVGCLALLLAFSIPFRDADPPLDSPSETPKRFKVKLPVRDLHNPAEPAIDLNESPLFDAIHFSQFTLEADPETTEAAQTSDPAPTGLPLQRYDLTQLRLAATIRSRQVNRALVKTPDGKGYIVREGTPIGRNNGFVIEIQKDRIVVEESLEGEEGEAVVRWEVLKLPVQEESEFTPQNSD